jgi:hypothetical protein
VLGGSSTGAKSSGAGRLCLQLETFSLSEADPVNISGRRPWLAMVLLLRDGGWQVCREVSV